MTAIFDLITSNIFLTSGFLLILFFLVSLVLGPLIGGSSGEVHVYPQSSSQVMNALYHIARATGLQPDQAANELRGLYQGRDVRINFYTYDEPLLRMRLNNRRHLQFQVWSRLPNSPWPTFEQRFKIQPRPAKEQYFGTEQPLREALAALPPLEFDLNLDVEYKLEPNNLICTLLFDYRQARHYEPLLEGLCQMCDTIEQL